MTTDSGFSNERTSLAWQRTALSVLAGAAILARLTFDRIGHHALVLLGCAAALCLWVFAESRSRYLQRTGGEPRAPRGGRAALALVAASVLLGITEAIALGAR